MRYYGQAFELTIPIPDGDVSPQHINEAVDRFHRQHHQIYGHSMKDDAVEFVNFRVSAVGTMKKPNLGEKKKWETGLHPTVSFEARSIFDGEEIVTPVFDRNSLEEGQYIDGPAIIGEMGSTIVVYPGQKAHVDALKNIVIYTSLRKRK
jgi:N-methylhydantoinase A